MQTRYDGPAGGPAPADPSPRVGGVGRVSRVGKVAPPASAPEPNAAEASRARSREAQAALLEEIRHKGIYAWLQERRFETLKAEIRARLAAANPYTHPAVIDREVNRELRQSIEQALKEQSAAAVERGDPPRPLVIDISV